MNSKTLSRAGLIALAIGAGVLFGQGCNWSYNNNATSTNDGGSTTGTTRTPTSTSTQTDQKNPNTKAADYRVILNALNRQHVYLSAAAMRSAYDGRPDMNGATAALDENSQELAGEIGKVYGSSSSNEFLKLWRGHIDSYVAYATATKANNQGAKDKAVQNLTTQAENMSAMLARANPNLAQGTVRQMLTDHANLMRSQLDSYASRDYAGSYSKVVDADTQAGKLADAMATAIIKQFPSRF